MRTGIVIKFYSNFVAVKDDEEDLTTLCTLRGRFKLSKIKPMVGDRVEYIISQDRGRIESIMPRISVIEKPRVSNVDNVVVIVARSKPYVQYSMIDRIVAGVSLSKVNVVLALNKIDITEQKEIEDFKRVYSPYRVVLTSTVSGEGLDDLEKELEGHISVFAGPSGVGKSSLLNSMLSLKLKTGRVSNATNMGRHTTTSASLLELKGEGFVVDTPGYIAVEFRNVAPLQVQELFPEIRAASSMCLFDDCLHNAEPECHVKELVKSGDIPQSRYESYLNILRETEKE
ncbi:MAG: ribosome small subunit-dependent GTPase A [Nitrospiraceae bacterium]|nr:ribosome small subunit-dependent GTPase A [Nitrospiraceae bacterium]